MRSDKGTEFMGEFDAYLQSNGIQHCRIATNNPRANGAVERQIRSVQAGIRKCISLCPGGRWWDFLGEVARCSRVIPTRATGLSPYLIVFKQTPLLPLTDSLQLERGEEFVEETSARIQEAIGLWGDMFRRV